MKTKARKALALLGACFASAAHAAPILVDFTDRAWSGADGQTSYSVPYGSLSVTVSSMQSNRPLTFNAPGPVAHSFLAGHGDGLGVVDDELSFLEPNDNNDLLEIRFGYGVAVVGYYLLDLFANEGVSGNSPEVAFVNFGRDGPNTVFFDAGTSTDNIGFYAREGLEVTDFTDIHFSPVTDFSDFAVAAILVDDRTVSVPEPSTLVLLMSGLIASLCRPASVRWAMKKRFASRASLQG